MTTELWYMAHPVGAADRAGVDANLARAGRWLTWLRRVEPTAIISAPWLATLLVGSDDDADPAQRARGLYDNCTIAARFGRIVLVGGRISSGMGDELLCVLDACGIVSDLTAFGEEPPARIWAPGVLERGVTVWDERCAGPNAWRPA